MCLYNGCIKSVTMVKHFRLQKIPSIEEQRKVLTQVAVGKEGILPPGAIEPCFICWFSCNALSTGVLTVLLKVLLKVSGHDDAS